MNNDTIKIKMTVQEHILQGIPTKLPNAKPYDPTINHAPKRKEILSPEEKKLALRNALRYFDKKHHEILLPEFKNELETYGRIYMYRFRPDYKMYARPIDEYPGKTNQAKAIMLMIQNNLDYAVAQHPHELITYGGNGGVRKGALPQARGRIAKKNVPPITALQNRFNTKGQPNGHSHRQTVRRARPQNPHHHIRRR